MMDEFQKFLLERINYYHQAIETEKSKSNDECIKQQDNFIWAMENTLDELVGAFSEYDLNYKCQEMKSMDPFELYLTNTMTEYMNEKQNLFNQPTRKDTFKKAAVMESNISLLLDILIKYRTSFKN